MARDQIAVEEWLHLGCWTMLDQWISVDTTASAHRFVIDLAVLGVGTRLLDQPKDDGAWVLGIGNLSSAQELQTR